MRLIVKGSLILLLTIGVQYLIAGHASGGALDETQFTMHVYVAYLAGIPSVDEGLLDAANSLRIRKEDRDRRLYAKDWRAAERATAVRVAMIDVG